MMDNSIPKKLGPYIIEDLIGRGGMGAVYRATDPETAETAAIKVLAPHLAPDRTFLSRFEEEVETLLELSHPNIVQLVSFGKQDEHFFFAMELVNGESLQTILKKGRVFGWAETLEIVIDICAGLHHSHNLGIIHRDIKPGNIILAENGRVKVADFGIAKRFNAAHSTQYGVVGTAEFMSPEQAQGLTASIQSDLYSVGAVMFMMLTGRPPIEGSTPQETLKMVVRQRAPSLAQRAPSVPQQLTDIVDRLLEKDPNKRFRSAKSVEAKLRDLLQTLQQGAEHETAVVPVPESFSGSGNFPSVMQSDVPEATMAQSGQATFLENPSATVPQKTRPSASLAQDTKDSTDSPFAAAQKEGQVIRDKDYFQRAVPGDHSEETESHSSRLITAIFAVGFLFLFGCSSYLIWDNVIRNKTADELFAVIEGARNKPHKVIKEIKEFTKRFPGNDRIEEVESLHRQALAYQYRNRVAMRKNSGGQMTDYERKFLTITQQKQHDPKGLRSQVQSLDALIVLIGTQKDKKDWERHYECLMATKTYQSLYNKRYNKIVNRSRTRIQETLSQAKKLEVDNPEQAKKIRESIIDLYGDDPSIKDLIDRTKKLLEDPK